VRAWEGKENIKKKDKKIKKACMFATSKLTFSKNPSKRPVTDDGEAMKKIEIRVIFSC